MEITQVVDQVVEVDARKVACPIPIMRAKKAYAGIKIGQRIRVVTTDPGSMKDFSNFPFLVPGSRLVSSEEVPSEKMGREFIFVLHKESDPRRGAT